MVEIVNVVGSGAMDIELDLELLTVNIGEPRAQYDPDKYPGMYLRFNKDTPLITLYRTGKYIVTGGDSIEETYATRERFLDLLTDMAILGTPNDDWFCIQNVVCTGELDQSLNLDTLAIGLGLEHTEYEPEQFPGLIYRPSNASCVALIFATGKVVITGSPNIDTAEATFEDLRQKMQCIF